jgi:uncharacterized membrane protein YbhN (UPF0104 family)
MDRVTADSGVVALQTEAPRHPNIVQRARVACGVALFGGVLVITIREWREVSVTVSDIGLPMLVVSLMLALAVLPFAGRDSYLRYVAAGAGIVLCAVVVAPPVLGRLANLGMRLARQSPLQERPSWSGILTAAASSVMSWLAYGLALGALAIGAGGAPAETIVVALPAVALAMTIGFAVAIAPSGIGVREAILVAALAPVLEPAAALGVAVVLRVVFTIADLVAAAVTIPIRITAVDAAGAV